MNPYKLKTGGMEGKHSNVPLQIGKQGSWEKFKEYEKQTELKRGRVRILLKKSLERVEIGANFPSGGRMALSENISVCLIS